MYAKLFYKVVINLVIFSLCTLCTLGLFGCSSYNGLHTVINDIKPSANFRFIDFHLSGDTLIYYRVRYPHR